MSNDTSDRNAAQGEDDSQPDPPVGQVAEGAAEQPAQQADDDPEDAVPDAPPSDGHEGIEPPPAEAPQSADATAIPEDVTPEAQAPPSPETQPTRPATDADAPAFGCGQPTAVVGFRVPGQAACYCAAGLSLKRQDRVVVEGERGRVVGTVLRGRGAPAQGEAPHKSVVRKLNREDERIAERNRVREREAFQFCQERIKAMGLPMKLVSVSLAHSGNRAMFNFTSVERVDFRVLVKDLARRFHTRIEMRQIGVRDAARHTGGLGLCGRELCCSIWLPAFKPISIRMAKDQNLSLNHEKLSGLCGRLRCCLEYEQETYHAKRQGLPKVGKRVVTPQGEGRVKDLDVLRRTVRVELLEGGYATFDADEVTRVVPPPQPPSRSQQGEGQDADGSGTEANADTSGRRRRRRGRRRRRRASADEPQGTKDEPQGTKDEPQGTKDEPQGTKDTQPTGTEVAAARQDKKDPPA